MNQESTENAHGPKYTLDIEGTLHEWEQDTIITEQIADLGGWDPKLGVLEIDRENNERTLQSGEVVELKPGLGFSKKIRWKRGGILEERLEQELALLRGRFPGLEYRDRWVQLPSYPLPAGWSSAAIHIAFFIREGFPGVGPYGIYVRAGLRYDGGMPKNYAEPADLQPPFEGTWGVFSWEATEWRATTDLHSGPNLLNWALGIAERFSEGL